MLERALRAAVVRVLARGAYVGKWRRSRVDRGRVRTHVHVCVMACLMSESCLPRAKPALVMLRARAQVATLMAGGIVLVWSVIDELASIVLVHRHQLAILTRSVGSRVRLFYVLPRKRIGGREQSAWQVGHAALVRAWAFFFSLN